MTTRIVVSGMIMLFFFSCLVYPVSADSDSNGYVIGSVVDVFGLPIVHAEVCAIPVGESGFSKCFYTDENGEYSFSVTPGDNILTVSKTGFITNSTSVTVNENDSCRVGFILHKLDSFSLNVEGMSNEFVNYVISDEIISGLIGACVNITSIDAPKIQYYKDDLSIKLLGISSSNITFTVDSDVIDFETIVVVRIEDNVLIDLDNIQVIFDQELISETIDVAEFFNSHYNITSWIHTEASDELYVFVRIPNFSGHTITIISEPVIVDSLPMIVLYVLVFVLLGFVIILPIVYYKRKKR